jgi:hypothetical protein
MSYDGPCLYLCGLLTALAYRTSAKAKRGLGGNSRGVSLYLLSIPVYIYYRALHLRRIHWKPYEIGSLKSSYDLPPPLSLEPT